MPNDKRNYSHYIVINSILKVFKLHYKIFYNISIFTK